MTALEESLANVDDAVASCMAQINDCRELLDETRLTVHNTQPTLFALWSGANKLDNLFHQIDQLEEFVDLMKKNINEVSERIDEMERTLSKPISIPIPLTSLIMPNSSHCSMTGDQSSQPYFPPPHPVEIFRTSDFFVGSAKMAELVVAGGRQPSQR
ncbi:hypothetical protein BC936DRAFT_137046 [Jimgerdemannia flammicorona]|uniref:Uncharacterized protein n=1 Tax=Jimgerdemannia flammicorona TaxID=994334 RepID=A0A433CY70_9FUNG|nr:hypothetical protein BC936DRAFT_137046 [Jimgerdemannia flammicorona]